MRRGDVVLADFPFVETMGEKLRPAIVVSGASANARSTHVVLAMVTTRQDRMDPLDVAVAESHPEFPGTGLKRPSVIRVSRIAALSRALIRSRLGRVGPLLAKDVASSLIALLELEPQPGP